ncbi:conserved hypothetical Ustilaginaceae-specific protein [Sporisorium reilianum SRZ2]|uniref:Conserved hypothetical Ustilaginaceae-specific protein n=1 Tax=Sporisorium reilianum (strain SRZ2) TaxID=999809 RepID=E6ZS64_SPORE|nr:conserved hypothetical Ustilaginaceae-specific protein [Sporisorium reilianum SRZ2]
MSASELSRPKKQGTRPSTMKTNFWSISFLAISVVSPVSFAMEALEPSNPTRSELLSANGYPGRFVYSPDGISDHVVRLLTQLRTTFRSHDAKVVELPKPTMMRMSLAEALYTDPDKRRFLHLGTIRHENLKDHKGWTLALPMSEDGSSTKTNVHGFALFSAYPKYVENAGVPGVHTDQHVHLHGYVHMQDVGNILGEGIVPPKEDSILPLPGAFVSLVDAFGEVRQAPAPV